MFGRLERFAKRGTALNQDAILTEILSDDLLQRQITDLNKKQLYEEGLQADGSPTGDYSPVTIWNKLAYGDARQTPGRVDHVTGNDTGETYESFKVINLPEGFVINAEDRNGFFEVETEGLGLTKDSIGEIIPEIKERLIEKVKETVFTGSLR